MIYPRDRETEGESETVLAASKQVDWEAVMITCFGHGVIPQLILMPTTKFPGALFYFQNWTCVEVEQASRFPACARAESSAVIDHACDLARDISKAFPP